MIGDAEWTAIASAPIAAGVDVKVVGQDNLTMTVEPL
jgi:membrane protein implicated in regulation of membrane protease activity